MSERAREAFHAALAEGWADPARLHAESRQAHALLDAAAESIAGSLGVKRGAISFTHSPHDAIERVIAGVTKARRGSDTVVVGATERAVTLHTAEHVTPGRVSTVAVDALGHVDLAALSTALGSPGVAMVAVQHANGEIGTVQRLGAIYAATEAASVPLIVDATASIGHIAPAEAWDALVAHPADWGGPSGIGVLALRTGTRWLPAWPEGSDWAPGGVSVPAALAAAVALGEREDERAATDARLRGYIARIRTAMGALPGVDVVGDPDERLPHVLTFSCLYAHGEELVNRLDREGFAVGSGSACTADTLEPSHVLAAIGALTHGNVRLGLHPGVTDADVTRLLEVLPGVVADVREISGGGGLV